MTNLDYFVPLEDYIDKYCPNLQAAYEAEPIMRKIITSPDGHIYTLSRKLPPVSYTHLSFLQTVRQKMRDQLNVVLSGGGESFGRDKLQKDFEAVGKTAGSEKIQFTGCTVQSCEVYR